jgi:N-acetylglucosamine-6-sulfatase
MRFDATAFGRVRRLTLGSRPRYAGSRLGLLLLAASLVACAAESPAPQPNIIVIFTDDQRHDTLDFLPNVSRLADEGLVFTNSFVSTPICLASRASFLTGRYVSNLGPFTKGTASEFDASDTIAVRLQKQGYITGFFGKYLNGYSEFFPSVPPGWDEWGAFADGLKAMFSAGSLYQDPTISRNGRKIRMPGYSTDLMADLAVDFIESNASGKFFLQLWFYAAHVPLKAAQRHVGAMAGRAPDPPPSLAEADRSDKPAVIPARSGDPDELRARSEENWAAYWSQSLEVLLAVDDAVARIVETLKALGIDRDTVVIFTSDNGFMIGEHAWVGKALAYEESIRVPLIVWHPGTIDPGRSEELVMNIDIAPTIAELAGAPFEADGESLAPLLRGERPPWRQAVRLEWDWPLGGIPGYEGIRTRTEKRVTWEDGFVEDYDLESDPFELENRAVNAGHRP